MKQRIITKAANRGAMLALAALPIIWVAGCGKSEQTALAPEAETESAPVIMVAEATQAKPAADNQAAAADSPAATAGAQLFTRHCASCHGETGDGNGIAARYLYPKPRNFRDGHFRMITTANSVPTDDDLMRVILRGMPGSAMLPVAAHLSETDRKALVTHIRELMKQGVEARIRAAAEESGDEVDPEELKQQVESHTKPGDVVVVPKDLPASDDASIARGREIYVKSCATCHGDTGKGDGVQAQRDEFDFPITPRDFTRGIFKGGRSTEQIYARITLGIPGTPMPSSPALKTAEIGDLINYVQSLSDPAATAKSEHKRMKLVAKKTSSTLPDVIPDAIWDASPATELVVSPLWWRNYEDPEYQMKAVHDGESLAIRVSWRDSTQNDRGGQVEYFTDMAAVEFFNGTNEPFLGMGSSGDDGEVDVWLWDGTAQNDRKQYSDVDTAHPNMVVDYYQFEKLNKQTEEYLTGGPRTHPTDLQDKTYITAWGAGNLRSDPTHPADANSIHAKGPGSITMRPRTSQVVKAVGQYQDGRWTVVLRRPLKIAKEDGISIAPGGALSVAFAVWDGSSHDRNGQKMVSIWHELTVE
ncbi:MAG: ethylbenzene dehydrogenase-related protein [Isosphaeraceae bacterium]